MGKSRNEAPDLLRTEIEFADHAAGAATIQAMFGIGPELLRVAVRRAGGPALTACTTEPP
jgi:hypothetical protein